MARVQAVPSGEIHAVGTVGEAGSSAALAPPTATQPAAVLATACTSGPSSMRRHVVGTNVGCREEVGVAPGAGLGDGEAAEPCGTRRHTCRAAPSPPVGTIISTPAGPSTGIPTDGSGGTGRLAHVTPSVVSSARGSGSHVDPAP